jgi:hypothetical protein
MATAHVAPLGDQMEHVIDEACVCGPTVEPVLDADERVGGFVVTHHSLDGREHHEGDSWQRLLRLAYRMVGRRQPQWGVFESDDVEVAR